MCELPLTASYQDIGSEKKTFLSYSNRQPCRSRAVTPACYYFRHLSTLPAHQQSIICVQTLKDITFALTAPIPIRSGLCMMFLVGHGLRPGNVTRSFTTVLQHGQNSRIPLDFISGPHALMETNLKGVENYRSEMTFGTYNSIQALFEFGIKALKPS